MSTSFGVIATHRSFHHQGDGTDFIARPDICDLCLGAYNAARRKAGTPADEQGPHPDNPPTYAELMRRAGAKP